MGLKTEDSLYYRGNLQVYWGNHSLKALISPGCAEGDLVGETDKTAASGPFNVKQAHSLRNCVPGFNYNLS